MSIRTVAYEWPLLGEIIDPEHGDLPDLRVGQRPHQPDQGETGDGRAQRPGEPGTRAAGQRKRDPLQQAPQPRRAALMPPGQPGHLLSERRHRARLVAAAEPADHQLHLHRPPAAGQILQATLIPVMHPHRWHPAATAGHRGRKGPGDDPHRAAQILHMIEIQARQVREQQAKQASFPASEFVQHN